MDSNQRSETNNQTNNNANEKWKPGSQGNTIAEAPLDHTYPQGASQQSSVDGTRQSGAGPAAPDDVTQQRSGSAQSDLPGGSMQTQQTGGSGAVQGVTDSHQRAMEQRSGAYGQLQQPVGDRPKDTGTSLGNSQLGSAGGASGNSGVNPQDPNQPELRGGSLGSHQGVPPGTRGGGQHGPLSNANQVQGGSMGSRQSATPAGTQGGGQLGSQSGGAAQRSQQSTDRAGSQTGADKGRSEMHQSNDSAGGLPRSPGNSGPRPGPNDTHLTGAQIHANQQKAEGVHQSNDAAGGYPKSPGGANKLAADQNMDDDTGFSNRDTPARPRR